MKKNLPTSFILLWFLFLSGFATLKAQTADNLALGKAAFASSSRDALPDSAFDGDPTTSWKSDYSDPQWIYVDLGASFPIKRVHLLWDTAYALAYELQVSEDAENWITLQSVSGNASRDNDFTNLNANGRYIRLYATSRATLYGYYLLEMEVYSHDDPPVVTITSPANNIHHLFTTTPALTATADAASMGGKDITSVALYSGSTLVAMDTAAPYAFSLSGLDDGNHVLTAKVTDESNAVGYSAPVFLRLSAVTPDYCNSPAWDNNTVYSSAGTQVMYSGRLYKNRWYTVGQDPLNNSGPHKVWELISTCATPTTVNITHPGEGDTFHALAAVDVHVDALATAPYRIVKVNLYSNNVLIDSDTSASFSFNWNDVAAGTYALRAEATDDGGQTVSSTVNIQVVAGTGCDAPAWRANTIYHVIGEQVSYQGNVYQNKWYSHGQNPATNSGQYQVWTLIASCPATAAITTPNDSANYIAPGNLTIQATAFNPGDPITKLEFYQGASLLAVDSTAPYAYTWIGVAPGNYLLSVKAYTEAGVVATSAGVHVTVKPLQGSYTWTGSGDGADWNDPANWSPQGVPGTDDSVTIASGRPRLSNNITVTDFTILSDTLDLNEQQLMVTGIARFTGGNLRNGMLNIQCSETWFSGSVFDTSIIIQTTCSNIYLNGSVFNGPTTIAKRGNEAVDNESEGGNVFNGPVTIANYTTFGLRLGTTADDDFNAAATFSNHNTGTFDVNYNGVTRFAGNITIHSNAPVDFGGGNGTILLDSNNVQHLIKTGLVDFAFNRLRVNKTGSEVILDDPLYINTSLDLINGKMISASDDPVIFRSGAVVNGASNASFIAGPVTRYGNGSFTFPVGKGSWYRPLTIAPSGMPFEAFSAEYYRGAGPDPAAVDANIHHVSSCEYWVLDRVAGATATPVTLSWDSTSCGVSNPGDLRVARWNGSLWVNEGNGGTTGNVIAGSIITTAPVTVFSPFTLASSTTENVLPVTLLSFTALKQQGRVRLNWRTVNEENNAGFTIERSMDGSNFISIGVVQGAGTSAVNNAYLFYDNTPLAGTAYYRLKQTDMDGTLTYSEVKRVEGSTGTLVRLQPNPTRGPATLIVQLPAPERCHVQLTDATGRVLYSRALGTITSGTFPLDVSGYPSGIYLVRLTTAERILYQQKISKQ